MIKSLNRTNFPSQNYPPRIIQFGEGNFMRAFMDWIVFRMNRKLGYNAGVAVVQPIERGMAAKLATQDGLYTLILKGIDNGFPTRIAERIDVISSVNDPFFDYQGFEELATDPGIRFIFSNTTEAGIVFDPEDKYESQPPKSYPGKLTKLLHLRWKHFAGSADKGLIIMPCELIDRNGDNLKKAVEQLIAHWNLGEEFRQWVLQSNIFCNTLVDRIVPGFPHETIGEITEELGYRDELLVEGEIFHLLVIEAPEQVHAEFPADKAGLNVLFVPSIKPYRDRKVTLLNGPHTVLSPVGYLSGLNTVRECVEDEVIGQYVRKVMFGELLESLDLPRAELEIFGNDVIDRFRNPFVKHQVTSIMLNSFPKYKTRDLPAVKIYLERKGVLPRGLVLGLAAIATYYRGGKRGEDTITPQDDPQITGLLTNLWATGDLRKVAEGILGATFIWGEDLNAVAGFTDALHAALQAIATKGMREAVKEIL